MALLEQIFNLVSSCKPLDWRSGGTMQQIPFIDNPRIWCYYRLSSITSIVFECTKVTMQWMVFTGT